MINKPRNDSEPDLRFQIKHFKRNPSIIMVVEAGCWWGEGWRCDKSNKHSPEHGAFSNFHYKPPPIKIPHDHSSKHFSTHKSKSTPNQGRFNLPTRSSHLFAEAIISNEFHLAWWTGMFGKEPGVQLGENASCHRRHQFVIVLNWNALLLLTKVNSSLWIQITDQKVGSC